MRAAVFLVVLAIHVVLFLLIAASRKMPPSSSAQTASTVAFFVPVMPASNPEPTPADHPNMAHTAAKTPRHAPPPLPQPEPGPGAITMPTPPDWRQELQIAANSQLAGAEHKRLQPSVLEPHDFSASKPGSSAEPRQESIWDPSATHRVEVEPGGGLAININERCAIVLLPLPLVGCRLGKAAARGDLFERLKDPAEARP